VQFAGWANVTPAKHDRIITARKILFISFYLQLTFLVF
jgi:hypothetical protein